MSARSIRLALFAVVTACLSLTFAQLIVQAQAVVVYSQPPNVNGGIIQSSWCPPGESNFDRYIWDNFTLGSTQVITEVQWRGGYDPARGGVGGPVLDFTVAVYTSTAASTQPDIVNPPLVQYQTGGNAGETAAGTFGGVAMYDYHFALPAPFTAATGIKYWLYLVASQGSVNCIPDWNLAAGTGGDNIHFLRIHNVGDTYMLAPGDIAFTLLGVPQSIAGLTAVNNSPTALGRSTAFTATVTAGNGISYTWNFGDGALGTGRTLTHTYGTAGFYTAIVTASNSLNTLTTTTPVTITLTPITGLVASNDSPTVLGHATHLTATVAAGSNVSYQWNFGDGLLDTGSAASHTYGSIGFYTAIVTASNSVNALTATTRITIADVPIAGLSSANDSPTLLGHPTTLDANVAAGSNVIYRWDFGDGQADVGQSVTHTYPHTGTFAAIVTATNRVNVLTATTIISITPVEIPISGLGAISDSPTQLGQTTSLTAGVVSGSSVIYAWAFGDGALGSGKVITHTFSAAGLYTAIVTASNSLNTLTATTRITITEAPIAGLAASNDSPTPIGSVTHLTATLASGTNVSYQWNFGDGALGAGMIATHIYGTIGFYTAIVTASNSVSVLTITTPITIFGTQPIANAGVDQTVPAGALVTLDGSGSFAPPGHWPLSYGWQQSGGPPVVLSSDTISRPTFTAPARSSVLTFTLVVTDSFSLASSPDQVQISIAPGQHVYLPSVQSN